MDFWVLCYAYHHQRPKDKLGSRNRKGIFIGYPHGKNGWKVYDLESRDMNMSRDVISNKIVFHLSKARKKIQD